MAESLEPIVVKLTLEAEQMKQQLSAVTSQVEKFGQHAAGQKEHLGKFSEGIKEIGKAAAAAFGIMEIIKFMKESATAAVDNQKSFALMELQLKTTTGATHAQAKAIDGQIEALSEQSGVLSANIRPAYATLLRVTHDSTKAMSLQKIAMDVSAGTGKDLATVTNAMAKAASGNTAALQKLVPGVKGASDQMSWLQKNFHGAAKTAADNNPYAKLQVMMEKLKVTLGTALMPVFKILLVVLKAVMPTISILAKVIDVLLKAIMPVVNALLKALMPILKIIMKIVLDLVKVALKPFMEIFHQIMPTVTMLAKFIGHLLKALEPVLKVIVKLIPFMLIFQMILIKVASVVLPPLINILDKVLVPIISILSTLIEKLFNWFSQLGAMLGNVFKPVVDAVGKAFKQLGDFLRPIWDNILKPMFDGLMAMLGIKVEPEVKPKVDDSELDKIKDYKEGDLKTGTGTGTGTPKVDKHKAALDAIKKATSNWHNSMIALTRQHNDAVEQAAEDHAKKLAEITKSGQDTMAQIIADSKGLLKSAFEGATSFDAGDLFLNAGANIGNFMMMLKDKLSGGKKLAADTAALAAAGYSQEFIDSIVAKGPEVGDALAQQLIAAGPGQAKDVMDLFSQVQDQSKHGVDEIADTIYKNSGLATEELKNQYTAAQSDLAAALASENDAYAKSAVDLQNKFEIAMAKLQITRDKAVQSALKGLTDSDSIKKAKAAAADIAAQNAIISASTAATTATTAYATMTPGTSAVAPTTPSGAGGTNITTNVSVATNASASDIATAVVNDIKFNQPFNAPGVTTNK